MALTQVNSKGIKDADIATGDIADDAITSALIADAAVQNDHIAAATIQGGKIANLAIDSGQLGTDSVTQAKLADEAVDEARLQISNAGTNGQYLQKQSGNTGGLTWADVPAGGATINNATENEIVTVASTTTQLDAEANLTFDGNNLTVTSSGGVITTDTNGFITSKQSLDAATAGGALICKSNRGNLGRFFVGQTAQGADGGYATIDTCASGSTTITERVRVDSSGNLKVNDGDLVIGTSGHGISFAATSNASPGTMSSELFDDYEEGTWTPDVKFNDVSADGQSSNGNYTKIGNMVYAAFQFTLTSKGSGDGQFHLNGFPFAPSTGYSDIASGMGYMHRFADADNDSGQVYQQFYSSIMYLAFRGLNNNTNRLTDDNFRNDTAISGMVCYRTNA